MEATCELELKGITPCIGSRYTKGYLNIDQEEIAPFIKGVLGDLELSNYSMDMVIEQVVNTFGRICICPVDPKGNTVTLTVAEVMDFDFQKCAEKHGYGEEGDTRTILILENKAFVFYGLKKKRTVLLCYFKCED